ncbi:MAG: hypothetical protein QXJ48_04020 [Candidatus Korarchaeum sp.]
MRELSRYRYRRGVIYFFSLVIANLIFNELDLAIYSPFSGVANFEEPAMIVLYLLIQSLGFIIANAFGYGIIGILAMSSSPLLVLNVDVEHYVKFVVMVSLFLTSWFSFYDGLWVRCGLLPLKRGELPLARTLRTFVVGGRNKVIGSAFFSSLIVPVPVALHYLFFNIANVRIEPEWLALTHDRLGFVVPLLPLLGVREMTYLFVNRLDYKSSMYAITGLSYLIPAVASSMVGLGLLGVIIGFFTSALVTRKLYPAFRVAR